MELALHSPIGSTLLINNGKPNGQKLRWVAIVSPGFEASMRKAIDVFIMADCQATGKRPENTDGPVCWIEAPR